MKLYVGMKIVAGPKGSFNHEIVITSIKKGIAYYTAEHHGTSSWEVSNIIEAIKDGYWKPLFEFKDYVDEAKKC